MKERIKSLVLTLLIISNFILGSYVLSTKKLWSGDGYNFFSDSNFFSSFINEIKYALSEGKSPTTHLEYPEQLIINTGYQTTRFSLDRSDSQFETLSLYISEYLKNSFHSSKKFIPIDKDDFYRVLSGKSIYIRYPATYDSALFAYLLGATQADFAQSFSSVRNVIISMDTGVYIEDASTGNTFKCITGIPTDKLSLIVDECMNTDEYTGQIINYAFDLGFDKSFGNQKALLSPIITLYSDEITVPAISASIPTVRTDNTPIESVAEDILAIFNMNPNVFRRYTEADGTLVYIENNATLKLSVNGDVYYTANDNGVSVLPSDSAHRFDALPQLAEFVNRVNSTANSVSSLQLSSNLEGNDISGNVINITFDYLANGILVKNISDDAKNAVTVTIEGGRIIKYKHRVRSYTNTGETYTVPNYIEALDDSIAKIENQLNDIEINSIDVMYTDDSTIGEKLPTWNIGIKEVIIDA